MRVYCLTWIACAATALMLSGCSLALDTEALQKGTEDTDTGTDTGPCGDATDCDDGIDCTIDSCDEDGTCSNIPDNDLCEYLEMCDLDEGCVPIDDECIVSADCDDEIDCTIDECLDGTCYNTADDTLCESDNPCIVDEFCDVDNGGCYEGNTMICEQSGAPCAETVCNPDNGECEDVLEPGADDDGDTYLDHICGGDDCNDTNEDAHPGAAEICNYGDDDCDGLTDVVGTIMPFELQSGASLNAPTVAHDGTDFMVVWQEGVADSGAIYARAVGPDGSLVTDPVNLTSLGGDGTFGLEPDVALGDGEFLASWVAQLGTDDPDVLVVGLIVDGTSVSSTADATFLETGAATSLGSPQVAFDGGAGSGWVAAWAAGLSDSTSIELQTENMHSHPTATFVAASLTGGTAGVSLDVAANDDYVLAWSQDDAASDGDLEVFTSRVLLVSDAWDQTGYPVLISNASTSEADPSTHPSAAAAGADDWSVSFTDVADAASTEDVLGWDGTTTLVNLATDESSPMHSSLLVHDGTYYALGYVFDVGTAMALEFRLLDDALSVLGVQFGRLALVGAGEEIRDPQLIAAEDSGFAAVWVENDGTTDRVYFTAFEACTPP
jgi:hypothetical protein